MTYATRSRAYRYTRIANIAVVLLAVVLQQGCSRIIPKLDEVVPDNRKAYQKAETLPDLEVPPDLSTDAIRDRMAIPDGGDSARYSTYQERRADVQREKDLEAAQTSAIRVLENEHVLAVAGAPVQVWPSIESFWQNQGYTLELNDVELGIVETAWSESEDQLSRDKFKIFAENGEAAGTTVLYISHENQELVPQGEDLVWERRPRNAEFERRIVEALEAQIAGTASPVVARAEPEQAPAPPVQASRQPTFGGAQPAEAPTPTPAPVAQSEPGPAVADTTPAAPATPMVGSSAPAVGSPRHAELVSVGGGKFYLTVAEDFPRAWKTTGRALEQAGVDVKDSDKGRGVFIVEVAQGAAAAEDDAGVWNKLKFWDRGDAAEYQVSLTGVGEKTEVVVLDKNGRWETDDQAGLLLNKLHEALNAGRI